MLTVNPRTFTTDEVLGYLFGGSPPPVPKDDPPPQPPSAPEGEPEPEKAS